ncbi:hypothetical protein AB0P05_10770, partial [Streptomyces flaveolus]
MSQQGGTPARHDDDWWGQLYDDSTEDTGPTAVPDSLDDRFASARNAVGGRPPDTVERGPSDPAPVDAGPVDPGPADPGPAEPAPPAPAPVKAPVPTQRAAPPPPTESALPTDPALPAEFTPPPESTPPSSVDYVGSGP